MCYLEKMTCYLENYFTIILEALAFQIIIKPLNKIKIRIQTNIIALQPKLRFKCTVFKILFTLHTSTKYFNIQIFNPISKLRYYFSVIFSYAESLSFKSRIRGKYLRNYFSREKHLKL